MKAGGKKILLDASQCQKILSLLQRIQTDIGVHPASHAMDVNGFLAGNKAVDGVRLTTQLHLVSRLRNDGSIGVPEPHHLSPSHGVYFISKKIHLPVRYSHDGLFPVRWNSSVSTDTKPSTEIPRNRVATPD